jgi:hypothetical protein
MLPIEDGIPIPAIKRNLGKKKYHFEKMKKGQSFFIRCLSSERVTKQSTVIGCAKAYAKRNGGGRFTTRNVKGGIRVWRVE